VKALREKAEADSKRLKEQGDQIAKLSARLAENDLRDVVTSKGLPAKVAKLAAAAGVEPTAEAVEAWVKDYGDVFITSGGPTQEPAGQEGAAPPAANVSADEQAALAAMAAAAQGGQAGSAGMSALEAAINGATDEEALLKILQSN
jgi:hypothetical protein